MTESAIMHQNLISLNWKNQSNTPQQKRQFCCVLNNSNFIKTASFNCCKAVIKKRKGKNSFIKKHGNCQSDKQEHVVKI